MIYTQRFVRHTFLILSIVFGLSCGTHVDAMESMSFGAPRSFLPVYNFFKELFPQHWVAFLWSFAPASNQAVQQAKTEIDNKINSVKAELKRAVDHHFSSVSSTIEGIERSNRGNVQARLERIQEISITVRTYQDRLQALAQTHQKHAADIQTLNTQLQSVRTQCSEFEDSCVHNSSAFNEQIGSVQNSLEQHFGTFKKSFDDFSGTLNKLEDGYANNIVHLATYRGAVDQREQRLCSLMKDLDQLSVRVGGLSEQNIGFIELQRKLKRIEAVLQNRRQPMSEISSKSPLLSSPQESVLSPDTRANFMNNQNFSTDY